MDFRETNNKNKRPLIGDQYISSCSRCRHGIFKDHEFEWQGCDGLVHINCNDPRLENSV